MLKDLGKVFGFCVEVTDGAFEIEENLCDALKFAADISEKLLGKEHPKTKNIARLAHQN